MPRSGPPPEGPEREGHARRSAARDRLYTKKENNFIDSLIAPVYEPDHAEDEQGDEGAEVDGGAEEGAKEAEDGPARWYNRLNDAANTEEGQRQQLHTPTAPNCSHSNGWEAWNSVLKNR